MKVYNIVWLTLVTTICSLVTISVAHKPDCADIYNGISFADPESCSSFYVCLRGEAIRRECTRGLYFDTKTQLCNLPSFVKCFNGDRIGAAPTDDPDYGELLSVDATPDLTPTIDELNVEPDKQAATTPSTTTTTTTTISTTTCTTTTCTTTTCTTTTCTTTTCTTTTCTTTTCTTTTCTTTTCTTTTCTTTTCTTTTCTTTTCTTTTCTTTTCTTTTCTTTTCTTTTCTTTTCTTTTCTTTTCTTTTCTTTTCTTTTCTTTTCTTTTCTTTTCTTTTCTTTTCRTTTCTTTTCTTTTCRTTTCSTAVHTTTKKGKTPEALPEPIEDEWKPPATTRKPRVPVALPNPIEVLRSFRDCRGMDDDVILTDARHCRRYYVCRKNRPKRRTCPAREWFDRETRTCRNKENVFNCPARRN